jgi:hypothetical protein
MGTDPVSETLCSLEYWTMDKVQKPSNLECYKPSSEPFRIYKITVDMWKTVHRNNQMLNGVQFA